MGGNQACYRCREMLTPTTVPQKIVYFAVQSPVSGVYGSLYEKDWVWSLSYQFHATLYESAEGFALEQTVLEQCKVDELRHDVVCLGIFAE